MHSAEGATLPHCLDKELVPCLPALWYCLHLPRTGFDVRDVPTQALERSRLWDFGHEIVLLPVPLPMPVDEIQPLRLHRPVLIVAPDDLATEAESLAGQLDPPLGVALLPSLGEQTLAEHWKGIHSAFAPETEYLGEEPSLSKRLDLAPSRLPTEFLMRQLHAPSGREQATDESAAILEALHWQTMLSTISRLEREGRTETEAKQVFEATLTEERRRLQIPVCIVAPGVAPSYAKAAFPRGWRKNTPSPHIGPYNLEPLENHQNDALAERAILDFLVTHRALSRSGLGIRLASIDSQLYGTLAQLERHCATGRVKPKAVWRLLRRIGQKAGSLLDEAAQEAVARASPLTVFSDFPLGLAVLPGDSAPLTCRVPIAYRPLLPLTRALQFELRQPPLIYYGAGFRVLIAECLDEDDPVGVLSRRGWDFIRQTLPQESRVEYDYCEVQTADELRAVLRERMPEALILSAHGHFDPKRNIAGIVIGDEVCLGPELGALPLLVLLSACHVSPRGKGVVSIADLLVRQGAIAILGTQVPVNVFRNIVLMVRFFVYIGESLAAREPERSVSDIWHRVATSNMINDITTANRPIHEWSMARIGEHTVLEEFMLKRSAGTIRRGHLYEDTEAVLLEIARDMGMETKVRCWLSGSGYVPESLFYTFIGWPERIIVQDPDIAALSRLDQKNR